MNAPNKYPYFTFTEIQAELELRRSNPELKQKVEDFLGDDFPDFLFNAEKPVGIISRAIFSPTMEIRYAMDVMETYKLRPLLLEYPGTFVSLNPEKLHLAKLRFYSKSKKGNTCHRIENIVDFQKYEGKPMGDMETLWGESLREFHHDKFFQVFPETQINDISDWFNKVRIKYDDYYYLAYLSLCVYHGVLFENFLFNVPQEKDFYERKIQPSIDKIKEIFGVAPLIHPIIPLKDEADNRWLHYPEI
jgi:hypothetical protein